jgi:phosphoesterase RecJ-like protein
VHTYIVLDDFAKTGALASDTEDLVNAALSVLGTEVAVILIEQSTKKFKVSFRSRNPAVDCNALAQRFGGGGHRAAAGATVDGPLEQAQQRVLDAVRAAMR